MSQWWTDQDVRALRSVAAAGVSVETITREYNACRGVRPRTAAAIVCKLRELRIVYGVHTAQWWTAEEDALLERMAGQHHPRAIARALLNECGVHRTFHAVTSRMSYLGVSTLLDDAHWLSSERVASILGCSTMTVIDWCEAGLLRCDRSGEGPAMKRLIRPAWLDAFIDACPPRMNPPRMRPGRYRSRAELRLREGRYLTVEECAAAVGAWNRLISMACLHGELPAVKIKKIAQQGQPRWWVRAADLMAWRYGQRSMERAS